MNTEHRRFANYISRKLNFRGTNRPTCLKYIKRFFFSLSLFIYLFPYYLPKIRKKKQITYEIKKQIFYEITRSFNIERLLILRSGSRAHRPGRSKIATCRGRRAKISDRGRARASSCRIARREKRHLARKTASFYELRENSLPGERASERAAYLTIIPLEILERVWYHRPYSLGSVKLAGCCNGAIRSAVPSRCFALHRLASSERAALHPP